MRQGDFTVYLVPFRNGNEYLTLTNRIKSFVYGGDSIPKKFFGRHDIYAVSNNFQDREKLEKLIYKHGGVAYDKGLFGVGH